LVRNRSISLRKAHDIRVRELEGDPLLRKCGFHGHLSPSLQDAKKAHNHLGGTLDKKPNKHIRSNPQPLQVMCELARATVEFSVS
jgi:hypothetical protein